MTYSNSAVTLSIRISPKVRSQLDGLAEATGQTKSYLAAEAIKSYLATQAWQVKAIKKAVKKANSKNAIFIDHNKVVDWMNSWNSDREKDMPK